MAVIEYHTSGSFNISDGTNRLSYYEITSVPRAKIDGRKTCSGGSSETFGCYLNYFNWQTQFIYSPCTLNVAVEYDSVTRELKVETRTTAIDTFPSADAHLRYVIVESHIFYEWQGLDSLHHVARKMLPNALGVPFSIQPGETFVDSQSYTLPSNWVDKNCYLAVFVQADGYGDRAVFCSAREEVFQTYLVGDVTGDGNIDVSDAIFLLNYLYKGGQAPNPMGRGDVTGDELIDITDAIYLLNYLYKGGPPPF